MECQIRYIPPITRYGYKQIHCFFYKIFNTYKIKNQRAFPANEILAKQQELVAEYNSKQYQRNRAKAYPSIKDQLDLQYWDKINNTDNWEQAINAVKAQYPKS